MWPTELNFHNACCHWEISFARSAASPGLAERQRARMGSRSRDGSVELRVFQRVERYFGDNPLSAAKALRRCTVAAGVPPAVEGGTLPPDLALDVAARLEPSTLLPPGRMPGSTAGETPAATSNVAARYLSSGNTPPSFVSKRMPCKFTDVPPPLSVNSRYVARISANNSSVQSRPVVFGENRIPSGSNAAWPAISFAASRYLVTRDGDMTSELPTFMKPSPEAESAGNSFAGSSDSMPVRSRMVQVYSAFESRRSTTGPGSPAWASAISSSTPLAQPSNWTRCASAGCGFSFGGISPRVSCSTTPCQTLGCFITSLSEVNRSRPRSPLCFSVGWQPKQNSLSSGRISFS